MTSVTRLSASNIAIWLGANYLDSRNRPVKCVPYPPVIPDAPDDLVIITLGAGAGFTNEKAYETRTAQIRCRATQNNPNVAEANAIGIDNLLNSMMMPWDLSVNGPHVIDLGWVGGGPFPMPADDFANRYSWVCNYYFKAVTGF